jgi:hypothetical protein
MMKRGKRRLSVRHEPVEGMVPGWFACVCGGRCGRVWVCRYCVPTAPAHVPLRLCEKHRALARCGQLQNRMDT